MIADFLYSVDKAVFRFLNRTIANPVLDAVMPFITEEEHWIAPIVLGILALVIFGGRRGRVTAALAVVILVFSDQIVNFVIKPLVGRDRPCFVLEQVRLLIRQPHSRSFPSSHAANVAAMALLFWVRHRRWGWAVAVTAFCVGLSRIVVGVHYPSDVAAGFLAGGLIAWAVLRAWRTAEDLASRGSARRNPDRNRSGEAA
ncbi:MAG: phosphatase PAP2 family protein [bacterium]|nr:phosphatase PAP2 family protein [bacterium]